MSGLLVHNTNQWSCKSLTGQQSENLRLGLLILGVWVSTFPASQQLNSFEIGKGHKNSELALMLENLFLLKW